MLQLDTPFLNVQFWLNTVLTDPTPSHRALGARLVSESTRIGSKQTTQIGMGMSVTGGQDVSFLVSSSIKSHGSDVDGDVDSVDAAVAGGAVTGVAGGAVAVGAVAGGAVAGVAGGAVACVAGGAVAAVAGSGGF